MTTMDSITLRPIGHIRSIFKSKNGTPRQSGLSTCANATLSIDKSVYNNPEHSLERLGDFSHVWILWIFHENTSEGVKAKVAPPRLKGERVGVFSTRSPHRPNPIGLSLVSLDRVVDNTIYISGVDMIDGTPVLDIKPYIPHYDRPGVLKKVHDEDSEIINDPNTYEHISDASAETMRLNVESSATQEDLENKNQDFESAEDSLKADTSSKPTSQELSSCHKDDIDSSRSKQVEDEAVIRFPEWINDPSEDLKVTFSQRALEDLASISEEKLEWSKSRSKLETMIREILNTDPRSVYRKNKCSDRLYYTTVDGVHVTAWFDNRFNMMEVLRLVQDS